MKEYEWPTDEGMQFRALKDKAMSIGPIKKGDVITRKDGHWRILGSSNRWFLNYPRDDNVIEYIWKPGDVGMNRETKNIFMLLPENKFVWISRYRGGKDYDNEFLMNTMSQEDLIEKYKDSLVYLFSMVNATKTLQEHLQGITFE